jgi:hypothetical protein
MIEIMKLEQVKPGLRQWLLPAGETDGPIWGRGYCKEQDPAY